MKKILCIAALVFTMGCSSCPERVAHRLIEDYVYGNVNDPISYESVAFGDLDTVRFSSILSRELYDLACDLQLEIIFENDPRYKQLYKSVFGDIKATPKMRFWYEQDIFAAVKNSKTGLSASESMNEIFGGEIVSSWTKERVLRIDSIRYEILQPYLGLSMQHSYRISDSKYGKKLCKAIFYFDRNLIRVDSVKKLKITTL